MQDLVYYIFCGMCLGGALGVITIKGFVNSAMSMLVSMLGVAGLLLLMNAYFLAFVMVMVYAGAVLVLFVFVVMLVGDQNDGASHLKKGVLIVLWAALCATLGYFEPEIFKNAEIESSKAVAQNSAPAAVAVAKNYGLALFTNFMLPFQVAGALLLAAMVGAIVVAKQKSVKRRKSSDMV